MTTAVATEVRFQCLGPMPGTKQCTRTMTEEEGSHYVDDDLHFCGTVCETNYRALVLTQERQMQQLIANVGNEMRIE